MLVLMRALAEFEDYIDDFAVTQDAILAHGFGRERLFTTHLVISGGKPIGLAVTYLVPWTFTLRPKLVLKEMYVMPSLRGNGAGRALFNAVTEEARQHKCDHITWTVMAGNKAAERFYQSVGGHADVKWLNWSVRV